eukprot:2294016-Amphidinium_carterae.1
MGKPRTGDTLASAADEKGPAEHLNCVATLLQPCTHCPSQKTPAARLKSARRGGSPGASRTAAEAPAGMSNFDIPYGRAYGGFHARMPSSRSPDASSKLVGNHSGSVLICDDDTSTLLHLRSYHDGV